MMYEHETLQDELDRRDGIPDYCPVPHSAICYGNTIVCIKN